MPRRLVFGKILARVKANNSPVRRGDIVRNGANYYMFMDFKYSDRRSEHEIRCFRIERGHPIWEWWQYPDIRMAHCAVNLSFRFELIASCSEKMSWEEYIPWFINTWQENVPDSDFLAR